MILILRNYVPLGITIYLIGGETSLKNYNVDMLEMHFSSAYEEYRGAINQGTLEVKYT